MGCGASRVKGEDAVRRCRERRRLMQDAVQSRHHLASAHADYLRALRLAGSALTAFARGEPLAVSDHVPPILLPSSSFSSLTASTLSLPMPQTPTPHLPARGFSSSPSPAIASSKPQRIHTASSMGSTPIYKPLSTAAPMKSTYATTPSQSSSSLWDWENLYPPSPPDSEYFERLKREREEHEANRHHLSVEEEEDVQCSEVDERYGGATTSSSSSSIASGDGHEEEELERGSRSERFAPAVAARSEYGGSSSSASAETRSRVSPSEIRSAAAEKLGRREGSEAASFSTVGGGGRGRELRMVVRHRDLAEIVASIEKYFVLAADAGGPVSELLETGRAQLERSFRQLKKTVCHSSGVLSALSSTWSSKPPLAIKYRLDTGALEESSAAKSQSSTLERLLAWEKKLYEEVKAREGVKLEHEKKLSSLLSQEHRGRKDEKLDKTKASIKKLQSLIIVASQTVSTTSSAIVKVRDNELAPQLVDMCYGIMNMWRSMNRFHVVQNHIVQQVRGLVNRANTGEATSDLHRVATRDLESAVSAWHWNFNRLIKHQRDYIRALHGWLRLTLSPVSSDGAQKDHSSVVALELATFCDEWKQALDWLPDTVASEAIKSFVNVVHVISTKQSEELKIKKQAEAYSKELEKKSAALRSIEKKFYNSYSMVGIGLPGDVGREGDSQVFDTRDPLAEKKSEIAVCRRKVEDEMARHTKAIEVTRSMTLNNIQTGLPGVFQTLTSFSGLFAEVLQGVCQRAGTAS